MEGSDLVVRNGEMAESYMDKTVGKPGKVTQVTVSVLIALEVLALFGVAIASCALNTPKTNLALKIVSGAIIGTTALGITALVVSNKIKNPNDKKTLEEKTKEFDKKFHGKVGHKFNTASNVILAIELLALTGLLIASSVVKSNKVDIAFKAIAIGTVVSFVGLAIGSVVFTRKEQKRKDEEAAAAASNLTLTVTFPE